MNLKFAAVQFFYLAALGSWVAGDLLIGALVLPEVFRGLPDRGQAGALASAILHRFALVKWACLAVTAAASALRYAAWEQPSPFIRARHAALAVLVLTFFIGFFVLTPRVEALRPLVAQAAAGDPARADFGRLHGLAMMNGLAGVVAGCAALFLS